MLIRGKQIKEGSVPFDRIETGEGISLNLNGSKITNVAAPSDSSDVATKEYVDALGKASSYCSAVDYVTNDNIRNYQAIQDGQRVLSLNLGSPGIYIYNASSHQYKKAEDWLEICKKFPNTTLVPARDKGVVYVAALQSAGTVKFTSIPQSYVDYAFQIGFLEEDGAGTNTKKVSIDWTKVASTSELSRVENLVNQKQDKLSSRNAGDGITISNQKISINSDSDAVYLEDGKLRLEYASTQRDGILSAESYNLFLNNVYGSQSDWEENNQESKAHIQHRTHYVQTTEINKSGDEFLSFAYFEWPIVPVVGDEFMLKYGDDDIELHAVAEDVNGKIIVDFEIMEFVYDPTRSNPISASGTYSAFDTDPFPHALYKEDVVTLDPKYLPEIILAEKDPSSHDLQKEFFLSIAGKQAGATIQIPKDRVIEDAGSGVTTEDDIAEGGIFGPGSEYEGKFSVGDIYLWFEIYVGGSPSDKMIYVNVNKLVDVYVGDGETILIKPVGTGSSMQISVIAEGVQSDWEEDDTSSTHYIKNKPIIPVKTSDLTNDGDGNSPFMTEDDIAQSDWEEDDATSSAHVLNRPAIRKGAAGNSTLENSSINNVDRIPSFNIKWNNNRFRASSTVPMNVDLYTTQDGSGTAYKVTKIDYDSSNPMYRFIFTFNTNPPSNTTRLYFVQKNGEGSHAENSSTAIGKYSHAENQGQSYGNYSHAEGNCNADGNYSHAEGDSSYAIGYASHAEGSASKTLGAQSHAEGYFSEAIGMQSHAEGNYTTATHASQHVFGEYNALDPSSAASTARGTYVEIVGNGTGDSTRSNARTLDWQGNETLAGNLTVNGTTLTVNGQQIEPQAQSDWNQTTTTAKDYIKNKPENLSDFNNDEGFIDNTVSNLTNYYDKVQVDQMISAISSLKIQVVDVLPTEDIDTSTIYLVPVSESPSEDNVYEEYIYIIDEEGSPIVGHWEMIGTAQVDLTDYMQKSNNLNDVADRQTALNNLTGAGTAQAGKYLKVDSIGNVTFGTVDTQSQADWNQIVSTAVDYIKNKPVLADIATSGNFSDLQGATSSDEGKVLSVNSQGKFDLVDRDEPLSSQEIDNILAQ